MNERAVFRIVDYPLEKLLILSRPGRVAVKQEIMEADGSSAKCVGLDDIRACLQILSVNRLDQVWLGELDEFEATFKIFAFPIVEAIPAIILFSQFMALDHGAHGAIEDDDTLAEKGFEGVKSGRHG
jgi:hypothetical protein